jgi:phosphatidylglycerol---prolipoprotein diacylglyceryl transferase
MDPVAFSIPVATWMHTPAIRWIGLAIAVVLVAAAYIGVQMLARKGANRQAAWEQMVWLVFTGVLLGLITFFMPLWPKVIEIRWYGVMMASSMLLGALISAKLLNRIGRKGDMIWDGLFWIILAGVVGARLVYVVTNPGLYFDGNTPLWHVVAVWEGGLAFHGGIIAGLIATYFYFRDKGIGFLELMDSFAPGVSLGIILVRVGNFMNGDISGYKWSGPWAMNFPNDSLHMASSNPAAIILRHPTELYGLVVGLFCLIVSIVVWVETYETRRFAPGAAYMSFIFSYSLVRSVIEEPFRSVPLIWPVVDPKYAGYGLFTSTQVASIFLILFALWGLTQLRRWERNRALAAVAAGKGGAATAAAAGLTRQARRALERGQEKKVKH